MRQALLFGLILGVSACAEPEGDAARTEATGDTTNAAASTATGNGAVIAVGKLPDGSGEYLTDGEGRTLYILENEDEPDACIHGCADAWPPFTAGADTSVTARGARQDLIATVARPDGGLQVTYNRHPLYYFARDEGPGTMTGHDINDEFGEWYVVTPAGEALEER